MQKIMTVYEAAETLQVHFNTIYLLVKQKKLKSITIGKSIRITEHQLNEFIEKGGRAIG
jgi:excisionase family DNA binding protein